MGNVLGAVRLNRMTDESTSPECQRDQMRTCARLHGHQVVQITEHTDVEARSPPRSARVSARAGASEPEWPSLTWFVMAAASTEQELLKAQLKAARQEVSGALGLLKLPDKGHA
jgi:hypothetical protein